MEKAITSICFVIDYYSGFKIAYNDRTCCSEKNTKHGFCFRLLPPHNCSRRVTFSYPTTIRLFFSNLPVIKPAFIPGYYITQTPLTAIKFGQIFLTYANSVSFIFLSQFMSYPTRCNFLKFLRIHV